MNKFRIIFAFLFFFAIFQNSKDAGNVFSLWAIVELVRLVFFRDTKKNIRSGETQTDINYTTDLEKMHCSCPDYQWRAEHYPDDGINRFCKHLRRKAIEKGFCDDNPMNKAICAHPHPIGRVHKINNQLAIAIKESSLWVDVFAPTKSKAKASIGEFERYGYSLEEKRWSYGRKPKAAKEIEKIVAAFSHHDFA